MKINQFAVGHLKVRQETCTGLLGASNFTSNLSEPPFISVPHADLEFPFNFVQLYKLFWHWGQKKVCDHVRLRNDLYKGLFCSLLHIPWV